MTELALTKSPLKEKILVETCQSEYSEKVCQILIDGITPNPLMYITFSILGLGVGLILSLLFPLKE